MAAGLSTGYRQSFTVAEDVWRRFWDHTLCPVSSSTPNFSVTGGHET